MSTLFNQWGNFLFHTRNILFPVIISLLLFFCQPVAINTLPGDILLGLGILMVTTGQSIRVLTIGLAYIVRGGRNRRIYAEQLVTEGIFSHCRNPLYLGNILIVSGFMFIAGNITGILIGSLGFMAIYRLIVLSEEQFLTTQFGQAYLNYCTDVPRWLPRLQKLRETIQQYEFDWPAVVVKEYGTLFTSLLISVGLISWKLALADRLEQNKIMLITTTLLIVAAYATARFLKKTGRLQSKR